MTDGPWKLETVRWRFGLWPRTVFISYKGRGIWMEHGLTEAAARGKAWDFIIAFKRLTSDV